MDIVERIRQLCARNDISIAALERQLNFGNGTIGRWSTASPTVERLGKVADYFGVSVGLPHRTGTAGNSGQSLSELPAAGPEPGN